MDTVYKDESKNGLEDNGGAGDLAGEGSGWEVGQIHLEDRGQDQSPDKFECQAEKLICQESICAFHLNCQDVHC